jgi:hypothetical protein
MIEDKGKFTYKRVSIELKTFKVKSPVDVGMTCDFCGEPLQLSFNERITYILCPRCRANFNRKIRETKSVFDESSTIGIFKK